MVKYITSFLISFKKPEESDVEVTRKKMANVGRRYAEELANSMAYYIKPIPGKKKVLTINSSLPGPKVFSDFRVSIAYWSHLVKIYGPKVDVALKTVTYNGKKWAAFSVHFEQEDLSCEMLHNIYSDVLEFHFTEDENALPSRVRNDKIGTYFTCKLNEEDEINFSFLPQYMERVRHRTTRTYRRSIAGKTLSSARALSGRSKGSVQGKPKTIEPFVHFGIPKIHKKHLEKAIRNPEIENPSSVSSRNCLSLPVINLFSDKPVWVVRNEKPLSSTIEDVILFFSAPSFLDNTARMFLNPFTINVHSIQGLPTKDLKDNGINKIYIEYELLPIIPTTKTVAKDLNGNKKIVFKDLKINLTHEHNPVSIINSLQTKKLLVRVVGIKAQTKIDSELAPKISEINDIGVFGSDLYDERLSSCIKVKLKNEQKRSKSPVPRPPTKGSDSKENQPIRESRRLGPLKSESKKRFTKIHSAVLRKEYVLGTAQVDLSLLTFGGSYVVAYEQISSEPILRDWNKADDTIINQFSITTVHADRCEYEQGIFKNIIWAMNNSMIKMSVQCGFLLTSTHIRMTPLFNEVFSRAVAIVTDRTLASNILRKLFLRNEDALGMKYYNLPLVPIRKLFEIDISNTMTNFLIQNQKNYSTDTFEVNLGRSPTKIDESESKLNDNLQPWLSGFCIDCVDKVLMFFEGPTIDPFPFLLTELMKINTSQGRVLYSSDLVFDSRLYETFKQLGGIYCVTLKKTIEDLKNIENSFCYTEAVIPEPAKKVLNMISKLLTKKNVLEVAQGNYLPKPEQLLSFDIEFGLPHCVEKFEIDGSYY